MDSQNMSHFNGLRSFLKFGQFGPSSRPSNVVRAPQLAPRHLWASLRPGSELAEPTTIVLPW